MTDLTTTHLKCLLEKVTPGPWEAKDSDCITSQGGEVLWNTDQAVDWNKNDHDVNLAAAAPQLAQELIRLRGEIEDLHDSLMQKASVSNGRDTLQELIVAENLMRVADQLRQILLGDHDE